MNSNSITRLVTDDDAASPVIGVILMVAVAVVLAAIIGGFVLGIGSEQKSAPQATILYDYDHDAGTVTIYHDGGQELDAAAITVTESGSSDGITVTSGVDTFSAGDVIASGSYEPGEEIAVVWNNYEGESSSIIEESEAPN